MTRLLHPPELERQREQARFDPVVEGARLGLSPELSLALWERVRADATDSAGLCDTDQAERRFHELAARIAARGGRLRPDVGRLTRLQTEITGIPRGAWAADELVPRTPGRTTLVIAEMQGWRAYHHDLPAREEAGQDVGRSELPRAGEVQRAMAALQAPSSDQASSLGQMNLPEQAVPLEPAVGDRMSRLFGVDVTRVAVVRESPEVTGSTKAVTKDDEVHFRPGAYQPGTPDGDWLIAHELAHVVQQRGGRGEGAGTRKELEREADRAAARVALGRAAPIRLRAERNAAYAFDDREPHDSDVDDAVETDQDAMSGKDGGVDGRDATATADAAHRAGGDDAAKDHAVAGPEVHGPDAHDEDRAESGELDLGDVSAVIPGEEAPAAPDVAGGGAPARPQKPAPDVAASRPEVALGQLGRVRPDRLALVFGRVHTAARADVDQQRAKLLADPPRQMSTVAPAAVKGGPSHGADPKAGGAKAATDPKAGGDPKAHELPDHPVKGEVPGGEADKQTKQSQAAEQQKAAPEVIATAARSIASWFGSWFGHGGAGGEASASSTPKMSEAETHQMSASLDQLPTTAQGVSTDPGPAPALAMQGEAKDSAARDRAQLETTTAGLESQGRADSRASMGEDHIETTVPTEELSASLPRGEAPADPALPTVAGAAPSEEVGIVAQEQHGAEIDAALTKASAAAAAERDKHAQEEARARAESDAHVREIKTKVDADQAAARAAAQAEVHQARGQWQAEVDQKGKDARAQADKKVAEGMAHAQVEETKANAEAKQHIAEGKRKADDEKQKGEKEAALAKDKGKQKSSGFFGWLTSKAKAAFDGIKQAVHAAIDACKRAVKAVIDAAKKLAMAAIELARKVIVAAIKAVGQALIAIGSVLLAAFPQLKARFQAAIRKAVDKAVATVNKLANGLKQAVQKALDLLGTALDQALSLLEQGLGAAIDAASAVVQGAIQAAQAVVEALGTWAKLLKDIATGPGAWIGKLGAAVVDGIRNHLWSAFKTATIEWFKSKVFQLLGIGGIILQLLLEGGLTREHIIQMALDALIVAIPAALVAILIEKLVSMIVPAAGAVMAVIEGLQAAWGTISRIIAAFSAFMAFLLAVKGGAAGALFAAVLASAAVVVLDFVANWLLRKLASAARKVGAKLKGLAEKFKARRKAKKAAKAAKKHHDDKGEHDDGKPSKGTDKDKEKQKEEDKRKRLADAVRSIRPKLAALIAKQPSKLRVRGQLFVWKLRHHLTDLRMDVQGKRVEFVAKVNPEDNVGSAEDVPLGEDLKNAESPRTGFYYRGDDEWRPGQSVGIPLTEDTPMPDAEELIAHVHPKAKDERKRTSRGDDHGDGPTKTFVSFSEIIGNRSGGAAKFTKKNRISKVARDALDRLAAEGRIRILTPQDVRDIIVAYPKAKIAREANNVMRTMQNTHEILIQGLIPGDLLTPAK